MAAKVLMLTGSQFHPFGEGAVILKESLERTGAWDVTITDNQAALTKLGGYRAVILHPQQGKLKRTEEQSLCRFVQNGGGLVGIHGAGDSFAAGKQYGALLGARVESRGPVSEIAVNVVNSGDPICARFDDFRITDEFLLLRPTARDLTVHTTGMWGGAPHPLVCTRSHGKGRVFYTALGYDRRAFSDPAFQRLIWRGLAFVTKKLKDETVRVAVVGYGAGFDRGQLHAETIRRIDGLELLGVCDVDPDRRAAAQEQLGEISAYRSVKEVAADRHVDLAVIVTPHDTHAKLALALLRAGKHVICERPLAITTRECEQLVKAAKQKRVLLSAFHNRRWDGDYMTLRRLVEHGAVGDVFHVEIGMGDFSHPGHWWRSEQKVTGSVLHDWGVHLVDWTLGLIPGRVRQVDGYVQKNVWHDVTIDDWSSLVMRFEGGQSAMIELGHVTGVSRPKWRVLGTRGSIWGDWGLEHLSVVTYERGRLATEKVPVEENQWDAYYRDVADHLLTGSPLSVTPEAARRVIAVIEAAGGSARAGKARPVTI